jgi:hypothetical protein
LIHRCVPILASLALVLAGSLAVAQGQPSKPTEEMRNAQRKHLDEQIPPKEDIERLMQRDLVAYFTKAGEPPATVQYELFRKGPTLAGVSSPKYYAWVIVGDPASPTSRGAVRMAAKDGQRFDVMNFFTVDQIRSDPAALERVFPKSVIAAIQEKMAAAEPKSASSV